MHELNLQEVQYVAPVIADYGSLQDLTASGGANFADAPIGTPVDNNIGNVAGSTP